MGLLDGTQACIDWLETHLICAVETGLAWVQEHIALFCAEFSAWVKDNGLSYQLSLSLASALIFYVVFNFLPQTYRKNKLKPIINRDLEKLASDVFFLICTLLQENRWNSAGEFQHLIRGGKLTRRDMYLGLQDKCFACDLHNDNNVSNHLFAIDDSLRSRTDSAITQIDKLFNLSEFISSDTIRTVEDMRQQLTMYSLNRRGDDFKPAVSSCAYLHNAYFPLYKLYLKLTSELRKEKHTSALETYKIATEYKDMGLVKKSLKLFRRAKKLDYPHPGIELRIAECLYLLGMKQEAYSELKLAFAKGTPYGSLVACRGSLSIFLNDACALKIIKSVAAEDDCIKAVSLLETERRDKQAFDERNLALSKYFAGLSQSHQRVEDIED